MVTEPSTSKVKSSHRSESPPSHSDSSPVSGSYKERSSRQESCGIMMIEEVDERSYGGDSLKPKLG